MILTALAASMKFLGLAVPAFSQGRQQAPNDFREDVAVSMILDEWCRRSGTKRSDPACHLTICRILECRASGMTISQVRAEILP